MDLNVPNGKLSQVKVTLQLESGKVVYLDEEEGGKAECPVKNWSVSFLADLEKRPVDLRTLEIIDPDSAAKAKEVVARAGLNESVFSIEYLFLKLTEVQLMLADNKSIQSPATVPGRPEALRLLRR